MWSKTALFEAFGQGAARVGQQCNVWPCPISPDTSDGMMMPGEKDDDTQQKNIH